MSEEKALLHKLVRGDADAMDSIYSRYKDDLLTAAMSYVCDIYLAEDCLQDVFLSLAEDAARFQIRDNLKGYLISCILNRAKNKIRKNAKVSGSNGDYDATSPSVSSADRLVEDDRKQKLFEAMAKLPDEQHEVIAMHLYADMKFGEIAKLLNLSINTVQSRYRYGLEKLKTLLSIRE